VEYINFIKNNYYGEYLSKYKEEFLLGEGKVNMFATTQFYLQRNGRDYWLSLASQCVKNSVAFSTEIDVYKACKIY
jgi:hypothetical protein